MTMKKTEIERLVDELNEIRLYNMSAALAETFRSEKFDTMDRIEMLDQIISPEYEAKIGKQFENRLKRARLSGGPQTVDTCKDSAERLYLPSGIVETLISMEFIKDGLNVCILGPSDSGKSYLAKAIGIQACLKYRVSYHHCETFLEELVALKMRDYQKYQKKVLHFINMDLLILDDFLLHTVTDEREIKVLFEVLEKRGEMSKSTVVCSQREPKSWASMILNDEVSSNAIMKRATKHYTVVIEPRG